MKLDNKNSCLNCDKGWDNFRNLSKDELRLVDDNRYEASFKAGEIVFKQGSPSSNVVFLISGIAKTYIEGINNKTFVTSLVQSGTDVMSPGMFVDNRYHYSLSALTDLLVCFVNSSVLKSLIHKNAKFAEGYIKDISLRSVDSYTRLFNLTQKKMHGRLAEVLVYLSEDIFHSSTIDCILTRQEIGDFTNMSKESVVRVLKDFHEDKILDVHADCITILDPAKLKHIMMSG